MNIRVYFELIVVCFFNLSSLQYETTSGSPLSSLRLKFSMPDFQQTYLKLSAKARSCVKFTLEIFLKKNPLLKKEKYLVGVRFQVALVPMASCGAKIFPTFCNFIPSNR